MARRTFSQALARESRLAYISKRRIMGVSIPCNDGWRMIKFSMGCHLSATATLAGMEAYHERHGDTA